MRPHAPRVREGRDRLLSTPRRGSGWGGGGGGGAGGCWGQGGGGVDGMRITVENRDGALNTEYPLDLVSNQPQALVMTVCRYARAGKSELLPMHIYLPDSPRSSETPGGLIFKIQVAFDGAARELI